MQGHEDIQPYSHVQDTFGRTKTLGYNTDLHEVFGGCKSNLIQTPLRYRMTGGYNLAGVGFQGLASVGVVDREVGQRMLGSGRPHRVGA